MNFENVDVKTTELNSLIYFLHGLTDEEFDRIFSGSQDDSINLNFNELVNIYYDVEPPRERKKYSRKYKDVIKHNSFKPTPEQRCFAPSCDCNIDPKQIDHFRDVVNEFIKYLQKENLKVRCTEKPSFNVSILENTK